MEHAVTPQLVDRLGRLAFDAMTATGSATGITRCLSEIIRNDPSRAQKLELLIHEDLSSVLARFAADITRALLTTGTDDAGKHLNNLSVHLSNAGDAAGALAAIREAV